MPRALFPEIAHVDFGGPEGVGLAFAVLFAGIPKGAVLGGCSRVERQGVADGGVLVVVGTVIAAVAFPAFIRYRVVTAPHRT